MVLIDASEPLTEQDLRIVSMVIEAGRALVIAYNKWDLVDEERQHYLEREIDRQLHTARWAPRVNISAATGRHTDRLVPALEKALAGWETRVPTGRLNAWLTGLVAATPPPVRGGRQPKILFATQAGIRPPHFVLFASGFLEAAYRRFVERRLREEFGFEGSPVQVSVRVRAKRESPSRPPSGRAGPAAAPNTANASGGGAGEGLASASVTGFAPAVNRASSSPCRTRPGIGSAAASRVSRPTGSGSGLATSTRFPNLRPRSTPASAMRATCGNTARAVATCARACAERRAVRHVGREHAPSLSTRRTALTNSTVVRWAGVRPPANTSAITTS